MKLYFIEGTTGNEELQETWFVTNSRDESYIVFQDREIAQRKVNILNGIVGNVDPEADEEDEAVKDCYTSILPLDGLAIARLIGYNVSGLLLCKFMVVFLAPAARYSRGIFFKPPIKLVIRKPLKRWVLC